MATILSKFRVITAFLSIMVFISVSSESLSQDDDDDLGDGEFNLTNTFDFKKLGGMDARLSPYGDNLMGDMIDKNTGSCLTSSLVSQI